MIHLYTGDGKGKTTAAFGLAFRAVGAGMKVEVIQFGKKEPSSEGVLANKLGLFPVTAFWAEGYILPNANKTIFREKAYEGLEYSKNVLESKELDVLILDEIIVCHLLGVVTREEIEKLISLKPDNMELILTGRGAPDWLIEKADLVSEMKCIKHYYETSGTKARLGIEF